MNSNSSRSHSHTLASQSSSKQRPLLQRNVEDALQSTLKLENRSNEFVRIVEQLQELADQTLRFHMPIFPQKSSLDSFVDKTIKSLPQFFSTCPEDIDLLHHLQRYAACYLAHKSGYFERPGSGWSAGTSGIKIRLKSRPVRAGPPSHLENGSQLQTSGTEAIRSFLAGCHPPMVHLLDAFQLARITGEIHLQTLARRNEDDLRQYLNSTALCTTALEVEALVQGFLQIPLQER
ncbi:hypothetical protein C8F04DRAFT_31861 [Mycena alexandri]|uniref:Uncharacterized protein n=1 Tax=Mycena alexandri TaxID=1745969 RepID=A0AAD6XAY1_9AGAR|nr:hypothetical protein C8F04DRAFT_31861 [Mycena alexandri]